jgi:hypothetical protein
MISADVFEMTESLAKKGRQHERMSFLVTGVGVLVGGRYGFGNECNCLFSKQQPASRLLRKNS